MTKFNKLNLTIDEVKEKDLNISIDKFKTDCDYVIENMKSKGENNIYYVLVDPNKPYRIGQIARLKPFLLARSRVCTANIAMLHIDNVVRIHTDCVVFNKEFDDVMEAYKTYPELKKEQKTSTNDDELMVWENVNKYYKIKKDT